MTTIILIISIICFINSIWWLMASVSGPLFLRFLAKTIAIIGTVLPIIYWLKTAHII